MESGEKRTGIIARRQTAVDWDKLPVFSLDRVNWTEPVKVSAQAKLCYDEQAIYVRLSAREKEKRAKESGPLGMPCQDSCLEFFLAPRAEDSRYLHFEFNANACLYLGIGTGRGDLVRLLPENQTQFMPCVETAEYGWQITYQIPVRFIQTFFPNFHPASGEELEANFYKCGDGMTTPHYLSWNGLTGAVPDFHRRQDFGRLIFA